MTKISRGRFFAVTVLALLAVPQVGQAQNFDALQMVPNDAVAAAALDPAALAPLFPYLDAGLFNGESSLLAHTLNTMFLAEFEIQAYPESIAVFLTVDDEQWAVVITGSVTGTATGEETLTYRDFPIQHRELDRMDIYVAANANSVAIGTLGAITGVIDTASGVVPNMLQSDVAAMIGPHIPGDAWAIGIARPLVAEAFEPLEELAEEVGTPEAIGVFMAPTSGGLVLAMQSEAETTMLMALAEMGMGEVNGFLEELEGDAGGSPPDDLLMDFGQRISVTAFAGYLSHLTYGSEGTVAYFDFSGANWNALLVESIVAGIGFLMATGDSPASSVAYYVDTEEATMNLRRLYDGSVAYYDADHATPRGDIVPRQFPDSVPRTPADVPCGGYYYASEWEWENPTWQALYFAPTDVIGFSYQYESSGTGADASFTASAFGDMDCDGVYSTFTRTGTIGPGNEVLGGAGVMIENEFE